MRKPLFLIIIPLLLLASFSFITPLVLREIPPKIFTRYKMPPKNNAPAISPDKIALAKSFISKHEFQDQFCFLINMTSPSGSNRFFVYDLQNDTISNSGLVTHGNCMQSWLEGRKYGNNIGCGCTSLGKYSVGKSYNGKFGLAYKLYGLDSSNSNAFNRFVVLHSHACVPEQEQADEICQSNGCPTVSPLFLKELQKMLDTTKKPVLLWIFDK